MATASYVAHAASGSTKALIQLQADTNTIAACGMYLGQTPQLAPVLDNEFSDQTEREKLLVDTSAVRARVAQSDTCSRPHRDHRSLLDRRVEKRCDLADIDLQLDHRWPAPDGRLHRVLYAMGADAKRGYATILAGLAGPANQRATCHVHVRRVHLRRRLPALAA